MTDSTLRQAQGDALRQPQDDILQTAHQRFTRDLTESERGQRQAAERLAREYTKVLQELAILFDGSRLESLRREDPKAPMYWTPDDWRRFFAGTQVLSARPGWGKIEDPRLADLELKIAELKGRLEAAEAIRRRPSAAEESALAVLPPSVSKYLREKITTASKKVNPVSAAPRQPLPLPAPFQIPEGMTPPVGTLLARARQVWDNLPAVCPAAFQKIFSGGRAGEDLIKAGRRSWLILHLIGFEGLNASLEIEDLLAMVCGMAGRSGSLGHLTDDLVRGGLLAGEVQRIVSPGTSLRLLKLSPEGVRLFKTLFDCDPRETGWERSKRLHSGEYLPERTLAAPILALHARKRGWATQILPEVKGTETNPDLLVLRDNEKLYVEIELGQTKSPSRWRNLAQLNAAASSSASSGRVALCAATPESRQQLAAECRLAQLPGLATDLETLVKNKHLTITDQTPLWIERW